MSHAKFAPSKAHRWIPCPGSIALERGIEQKSSHYADEGSAAHHYAQAALSHKVNADFYIGAPVQVNNREYRMPAEWAPYIQDYIDDVRARIGDGTLLVEQRLEFSESIGQPDSFGTGDAVIISGDGKHLQVGDLKFGLGVQVFAKNNEQGLMYLGGALETYSMLLDGVEKCTFFVNQPRLEHRDEYTYTVEEVRDFMEKAKLAAKHALAACEDLDNPDGGTPDPTFFSPGEKQCRFCPALAVCDFARRRVAAEVYDDFKALEDPAAVAIMGEPPVPAGERLGAAYGVLGFVENWCRGVRAECERMVMAGMTVIGPDGQPMKVIEGKKGNRSWAEGSLETVTSLLCGLLGPDKAYKPREVITPSAADKMFGKKRKAEFETALKPHIVQPDGRPKVVLGSDPAPAYTGYASAGEFEIIKPTEE